MKISPFIPNAMAVKPMPASPYPHTGVNFGMNLGKHPKINLYDKEHQDDYFVPGVETYYDFQKLMQQYLFPIDAVLQEFNPETYEGEFHPLVRLHTQLWEFLRKVLPDNSLEPYIRQMKADMAMVCMFAEKDFHQDLKQFKTIDALQQHIQQVCDQATQEHPKETVETLTKQIHQGFKHPKNLNALKAYLEIPFSPSHFKLENAIHLFNTGTVKVLLGDYTLDQPIPEYHDATSLLMDFLKMDKTFFHQKETQSPEIMNSFACALIESLTDVCVSRYSSSDLFWHQNLFSIMPIKVNHLSRERGFFAHTTQWQLPFLTRASLRDVYPIPPKPEGFTPPPIDAD